jgi:hypothetical protein
MLILQPILLVLQPVLFVPNDVKLVLQPICCSFSLFSSSCCLSCTSKVYLQYCMYYICSL